MSLWSKIKGFFLDAWNGLKSWTKKIYGAGATTTKTIYANETPITPEYSPITVTTGTETTQTITDIGDSTKPISFYADGNLDNPLSSTAGMKINAGQVTLDFSVGADNYGVSGTVTHANTTSSLGLRMNLLELKTGVEWSNAVVWDNTTQTKYTNVSCSGWFIAMAFLYVYAGQSIPISTPAYSPA